MRAKKIVAVSMMLVTVLAVSGCGEVHPEEMRRLY